MKDVIELSEKKDPVESDAAVYVDVDAEIQKELEDRLSSSLIDKAQLELLEKLGEGKNSSIVFFKTAIAFFCWQLYSPGEFGIVFCAHYHLNNGTNLVAVKTLKGM